MQADVLDGRPDNRKTTGLCREHVNLIGALAHIAEQALNGIGRLNVAVYCLRKRIKRQQVLFILSQASHRLWIPLAVFGFEGHQLGHCLLFCGLIPDANEFGGYITTLSSGDRIEHITLFMQQTALPRGCRKKFRDGCKQSIMAVGDDQIDVGCSS